MKTACNVEKQHLMNAIYQCGFAISDITLFLDTHPKDQFMINILKEALQIFLTKERSANIV